MGARSGLVGAIAIGIVSMLILGAVLAVTI